MPAYTYVFTDLMSGLIKAEMPLRSVTYGDVLNAPGALSASIDRTHPKATRANVDPGRTAVYVLRDDIAVWGGILWTARVNGDGLNLGAEGFWSYYRRRVLKETFNYVGAAEDPLLIAEAMLNWAHTQSRGDIGVVVEPPTGSGQTVERVWYAYERKNIGAIIEALTDNAISFDFAITPEFTDSGFINTWRAQHPQRGRRTGYTWEIGTQCELSEYLLDATKLVNTSHGVGAGDGDATLLVTAADADSLNAYPLLEETSMQKDIAHADRLDEILRARVASRKAPRAIPNVFLRPGYDDTTPGAFITGDEVRLTGGDGFSTFDLWARIDSFTVEVSDEGKERVKVEFLQRGVESETEASDE